jgi:glyoxylase-like metal-dependent hydrolase (beta-lactamase superfamily II)
MKTVLRICVMIPLLVVAQARADLSNTKVAFSHIQGNVYLITKSRPIVYQGTPMNWIGNLCASIGSDGILLVDNCLPEAADTLLSVIREISDQPIRYIINTHWHTDHTGSNHLLGNGACILAHTDTRDEMSVEKRYSEDFVIPAAPQEALPSITFQDTVSVYFNGEDIRLIPFPNGHTPGDVVVYFTVSKVIYMGDTYNGCHFPRVAGDVKALAAQFRELLRMLPRDVAVVSGHRALATYDDLMRYHRMLSETVGIIRQQAEEGKLLEEIKNTGLPEEWQSWGRLDTFNQLSVEQWIENVYHSLQ